MLEILKKLVELKKQEADLKIGIALAQKEAIAEAMKHGKTGTIASIEGAKVIFKLAPVKPKPTEEILELQQEIDAEISKLRDYHRKSIEALEYSISILQEEIRLCLESDRTVNLQIEIDQKISELQGEMQPQISVTLPKS